MHLKRRLINMKGILRVIILITTLIMCLAFFSGCKEEFALDRVTVYIKAEYKEKFLAEGFTVEEFNWGNIEKLQYNGWLDLISEGDMTVYLKENGKAHIQDAVEHFVTLSFVQNSNVISNSYQPINDNIRSLV